jgi:hypothetical protein
MPPAGWAAEADPSVLGYGAGATGAVVAFEDNVRSNCDFLIAGSTTGTNGTYVAGDPYFDVYAAGGLNAFACNTTFLGFEQFSFWRSCMGSPADSRVVPDAKLARRLAAARLPGHRLGQEPDLPVRRAAHPGPRRPVDQHRRHAPRRPRALERRRMLAPPVGGLRVRRAHDHDQGAHAAGEHRRQERADAEERGQLRAREHRRRQ